MLVIDAKFLTPDKDSGSFRLLGILTNLQQLGFLVTYGAASLENNPNSVEMLQKRGIHVLHEPYVTSIEDYIRDNGALFDVVFLERVNIAAGLIDFFRESAPDTKILFDTVDLHFLREQRMGELINSAEMVENANQLRDLEVSTALKADVTLVVSTYEKELLQSIWPVPEFNVEILSNIHDVHGQGGAFEKRSDIMFIGGFEHIPNVDAMVYYVENIFPLIKKRLGNIKTFIVGSKPPEQIKNLASDDIIVTGYVKDVSSYFKNIRIFVAPLRYGAGVKGKVNMSMSYGLPVVATSMAAEGMFLKNGEDVLMADSADDFADKVVSLYHDKVLWQTLSKNGLKNVQQYFSQKVAGTVLKKILC